ncbi:MAG: hypothetical protein F4X44_06770 [Gammaproteobacteria bacterium]|nr:hypothetical protein [Gammaproteobacteria bacterium]MYD80297.1 hypothetical protein [Gammaproteobacteria bacterium]
MIRRLASSMALVAGLFCLFGTSVQAVDLEDVYLTGGVVHWPEFGSSNPRFSFAFPTIAPYTRTTFSESSSQTSFKIGAGYSLNNSWSIEAVAIVGMNHETHIPSLFDGFYPIISEVVGDVFDDDLVIDYDLSVTHSLKASILRINPVYTASLQRNFFVFGAAGIAFIERDVKTSIRTEYRFDDELSQPIDILFPPSVWNSSESDSTANLFASAGLKWSPNGGRSAISISYSNYFDTPGDVTNSLELDYQWKF